MWRVLGRKARRDLRSQPGASVLLVLVVALATTGIVAGLGQQAGAEAKWDAAFARANGAHLVLYDSTDPAPAGLLADPAVASSDQQIPTTRAAIAQGDERTPVTLRGNGERRPTIGTPLQTSGRWLAPEADDEVVVDRSVALGLGIHDGDVLTLTGRAGSASVHVVGTALDLVDCFYPQCGSAPVFVSPELVRRLDPQLDDGSYLLPLRLVDPEQVAQVGARLQQQYGDVIGGLNDWKDTRKDALSANAFFGIFLGAFAVVLLVAAALVLSSSLSSRTLSQYRELGMLKAVGFTPGSITTLVLVENAVLATAGIALGIVVGALLAPHLQLRFSQVIEGGSSALSFASVATAVVAVIVIVGLATALPARHAGQVPASQAIALGADRPRARASRLAGLATRLRLGAPATAGVKDAFARPLRATLVIATFTVTVVAFVITLGFVRTVDRLTADPALLGTPYDLRVEPSGVAADRVESALGGEPGVASWFTATSRRATTASEGTFLVRAVGGDVAGSGFVVREGRQLASADEAVVGYGLLKRLGLHVGDQIDVAINGKPVSFAVVGWYAISEDSGEVLQISLDGLRRVEPDAEPDAYLVRLQPDTSPVEVGDRLRAQLGPPAEVRQVDRSTDELDAFRAIFFILTAVLLLIGLVNLAGTMALTVHEHLRDMAVLKTIGFTPAQVVVSVAATALVFGVVAIAIGVPGGLALLRVLLDEVGRSTGLGPGVAAEPTAGALALTVVGGLTLVAAVGMVAARRAARSEVSSILRAE